MHTLSTDRPPFDPRDPRVTAALHQQERDRTSVVLDIGKKSPRSGLDVLIGFFPADRRREVCFILETYIALELDHGSASMARILARYRLEERL